jgi:hypothetical protein
MTVAADTRALALHRTRDFFDSHSSVVDDTGSGQTGYFESSDLPGSLGGTDCGTELFDCGRSTASATYLPNEMTTSASTFACSATTTPR